MTTKGMLQLTFAEVGEESNITIMKWKLSNLQKEPCAATGLRSWDMGEKAVQRCRGPQSRMSLYIESWQFIE